MKGFSVHILNPKKRKTTSSRKKSTRKKASRKKSTRKKTGSKKKATTRTISKKKVSTTMAKKRRRRTTRRSASAPAAPRRRRRRNPSPAPRRRRRRSNPSGGGGSIASEVKSFMPRLAGKLAVAWAVRRWGGPGSIFGDMRASPTAGESWSMGQYLVAGLVAQYGPKLLGKFVNPTEFRRGAWDLILTKLIWTEGISRSPWAQQQFGTTDSAIAFDPGVGQMYLNQGGQWSAMQGLVESSALDGLVEASPMDGTTSGYGHLLPTGSTKRTATRGKYHGTGHTSIYHAAFSR